MYTKDDVANLVSELGKREFSPPIEVGSPDCFGLGLEVFDPVSGQIITAARPHRSDLGEEEIHRTADEVAVAIAQARANRASLDRARGYASPEESAAAAQRATAERELRAKHADEWSKFQTTQAEKAAADTAPARDKALAAKDAAARDSARSASRPAA